MLHGLGFDEAAQQRPCSDFSGGWRMRVALAAVLFSEPDLLLLDEPTNYLDLEGTLWLYDYLERYPHTVLVVSHDRELLDTCVDHILHLDQGKLTLYRGGYTSFARQRAEKQMQLAKAREKQDAERKHLQAFVDRFKAKASKARQAQSRVKRLEKMETIATIVDRDVQPFSLPGPERPLSPADDRARRCQRRLWRAQGAVAAQPDAAAGRPHRPARLERQRQVDLLQADRRQARAALGRRCAAHRSCETAYFAQHQLDELRLEETPVAHMRDLMPDAPEAKVRSKAAQIGFPAQQGRDAGRRTSPAARRRG